MSNFLHQKLTEQTSPSIPHEQEQDNLTANLQHQTSLDERIRSIFNNKPDQSDGDKTKTTIRKSLPLPPTSATKNHKHISSKKRSTSLGGKATHKKVSSLSSSNHKHAHSSSTTATSSSSSKKSSTKKSRDSKLPVNIKTISEVVVDVLNPFYQANRFSSKVVCIYSFLDFDFEHI